MNVDVKKTNNNYNNIEVKLRVQVKTNLTMGRERAAGESKAIV